jgi:hypothetical protein
MELAPILATPTTLPLTDSRSAFTTIGRPPSSTTLAKTRQVPLMRCGYSSTSAASMNEMTTTATLPRLAGGEPVSGFPHAGSTLYWLFNPHMPTNGPVAGVQEQKPVLVQVAMNVTSNTTTTNGTEGNGSSIDFGDDGPLRGVTLGITILSVVTIFLCIVAFLLSTRICWRALERDYSRSGV